MKTRALTIASIIVAIVVSAGCTAVYKNSNSCVEKMRSAASEDASAETLKIAHTGAGIDGSRVVVEGTFEHVMSAAEAASATRAAAPPAPVGIFARLTARFSSDKPKKVVKPAAVECTFDTAGLSTFRWLAPPSLAKPVGTSDSESSE